MAVYMIGNEVNRLVKIGMAIDPPTRLKAIQQMSPVRLSLLWTSPPDHYSIAEQALHDHFSEQRRHGEWFDLEGLDPVVAISQAFDWIVQGLPVESRPRRGPHHIPVSAPVRRSIVVTPSTSLFEGDWS